jgi:HK97 family phage major capsid protein
MDVLASLRAEYAKAVDEMTATVDGAQTEDRPMSEEEQKTFDQLKADAEKIKAEVEQHEATGRRIAVAKGFAKTIDEPNERKTTPPEPAGESTDDFKGFRSSRDFTRRPRYGKTIAFSDDRAGQERAYRAGQWLRGRVFGDPKAAQWCVNNGMAINQFAVGESTNAAGGFLVPEELESAIIDLREQYGVFRRESRVLPMARDIIEIPRRASGVTASFTGESTALTESDPSWNRVTITAQKAGVLTRISSELAEDAIINIADWVAQEFAYAMALLEDQCGFIGDGTSTYGGMVGTNVKIIDGNHGIGAHDAAAGNDTFAEIDLDDIVGLMAVLPEYADGNAKWYISKAGKEIVFGSLAAAAGGNTIQTLAGGFTPSFLGHEIVTSQVMPTSTGDLSDAVMFLYGDLRLASTMGVRRDIRIMLSDQRYFAEDELGIKATHRFGINVHDLGDGSTGGPVVAMVGE